MKTPKYTIAEKIERQILTELFDNGDFVDADIQRILDRRAGIVSEKIMHLIENTVQEQKICNDCQRFKHDSPEFPTIGKCYVGEYHCSRKETDVCDKPDDFKKRK